MKKIISLILTVLILSSFATVGLAADDYNVSFVVRNVDGEVITDLSGVSANNEDDWFYVDIYLDSTPEIDVAIVNFSYDESLVEFGWVESDQVTGKKGSKKTIWGDSLSSEALPDGGMSVTYSGSLVNTGSYVFDDELPLLSLCFYKKAEAGNVDITIDTLNLAANGVDYFAVGKPSISLSLDGSDIGGGEEDDDDVNVIVPTDVKDVTADTVNGEATDYQIGSGLGMTVVAPEGVKFNKMKWAITTDAGRLFSHKTIDLPDVSGEFKVAATFINGVHENGFGITKVDAVKFSEVAAIFGFVDENDEVVVEYYTNADDAEYKNK